MNREIALAVCYYQPEKKYISNACCVPVQLGFSETQVDFGIERDDTGDNRSNKHPLYSEYSGVYWVWKNIEASYKGMLHHRRFLTTRKEPPASAIPRHAKGMVKAFVNIFMHKPYHYNERVLCSSDREYERGVAEFCQVLPGILSDGNDIIVPRPYCFHHMTVGELFDEVVTRQILSSVRLAIQEKCPSLGSYYERTWAGDRLYYGSLEIMRDDLFDRYCETVFGVFDVVEKDLGRLFVDPCGEMYLYRTFGYIGELLTNSYVLMARDEGARVKELTMLFNGSARGNEDIDYKNFSI